MRAHPFPNSSRLRPRGRRRGSGCSSARSARSGGPRPCSALSSCCQGTKILKPPSHRRAGPPWPATGAPHKECRGGVDSRRSLSQMRRGALHSLTALSACGVGGGEGGGRRCGHVARFRPRDGLLPMGAQLPPFTSTRDAHAGPSDRGSARSGVLRRLHPRGRAAGPRAGAHATVDVRRGLAAGSGGAHGLRRGGKGPLRRSARPQADLRDMRAQAVGVQGG